ncbi:MAG: SMP-30/gluconolactonase/LRE family protein [Gammaproteobacteria bacterium]|nr:SMP-30/gluconolactonase/LRE family protein [Gammaproteobacteria bacterium]MBT7308638.1 SMP-30/gluconolactonase/LRE family protein [Gammaproteobacteria bacterium]
MNTIHTVFHPHCLLAESPLWDPATETLFFVDIKGRQLHAWSPHHEPQSWPLDDQTGAIALRHSGGLIGAQKKRFISIQLSPFEVKTVGTLPDEPEGNRFNDGKCDALGRFWAATMDDACRLPTGAIWSINPLQQIKQHDEGYIVGNGFGWNRDNTRFYFTDSENRTIYTWDFDLTTGAIENRRIFATIAEDAGYPDGLCVDAEDFVWSAHWDGGRITRYRPDGEIDRVIPLPVPRPTSLAFGGEGLTTLFITTASVELSSQQLIEAPLSGAILALACDTPGLPSHPFRG